ncbi:N-acylglucosamine 2-epimerase [Salegentibacter echinorum]|uniref:N-acylglucosamine 2-epimerase n=1 Tax=Salegentibacter echinorum TaxID=1073325 RepID=A0A1M5HYN3_SALEC|nr:AGE family epimerase/isomerase [Salegentibacter echinorum]SHG21136.1 N-acylglucosamine 2-epimerase [Salegentibacter echinorum]
MRYSALFKEELLENVIPFWEKYSLDKEFGGYFTCLTETGEVYDSDKFIWLQGRQAWMFSYLYNNVAQKDEWLKIAKKGIDFLIKHGMDADGNFYFSTTREGKPLVQPYNIFSDCFAAMAFGQYAKATGDKEVQKLAKQTYLNILDRKDNPKGKYEKSTGNRPLRSFALPMILSNLVLELEDILSEDEIQQTIDFSVKEVMDTFLQEENGLIYESLNPDGTTSDSFEGRLINPGHGLEAMWFMIAIAERNNDTQLINKAVKTMLNILDFGWDKEHGGIFYFLDVKGHPTQQLEWDQKLWWVHLEALVALSKAYLHTKDDKIWAWYEKVHDYTFKRFPDPENGEWFGYLNRQGEPHSSLKGGKWKGCFHVPRGLFQCWKTFEKIEAEGIQE